MKLLLLISAMDRGGAETHLFTLASALHTRGHSVSVVSSGGSLAEKLAAMGIPHLSIPHRRRSPFTLWRAKRALRKLLRKEDYDLIHSHSRISSYLVFPLARRYRIPLVTTVHAKFKVTPFLRKRSRWGDFSIAVSEDLRQYVCEEYGIDSARTTVIPNGIDTDRFFPATECLPDAPLRLTYLSRLDFDSAKAAFLLCRIAPRLKYRFPSLEITLVGGGKAVSALQKEAEKINGQAPLPYLFSVGHVSDPLPLYQRSHAVVGASRVLLEAMSCGVPVVGAGDEGFWGRISKENFAAAQADNFCGREATPLCEEGLFTAISELLLLSAEERHALGEELRRLTQETYDAHAVAKETEAIYTLCLCERIPATRQLVFCGYYGYGNTGDHALLRAAIRRAAKEYPALTQVALTARGRADDGAFGIRCVKRTNPFSVARAIRRSERLIFGGGTLLQDGTSFRSLLYYTSILRYAQRKGVITELWGNGLGDPRSTLARRMMIGALRRCDRIGLRDDRSLVLARTWLSNTHCQAVREEDLAEATVAASPERIAFLLRRYGFLAKNGRPCDFVVLLPRGSETHGQIHVFSLWLGLVCRRGVRPLFVPMFPKEDGRLCRKLADRFHGTVAEGLGASDLVGLMRESQLVGSMRLHGLVFSVSAGVPFVGFGEDPKIETYCKEKGGHYWTEELPRIL